MSSQQLLHGAGLDAVIGMYPVIHRLRTTVVTPVVAASLGDPNVVAANSVLLYGPPRCGGGFIAEQLSTELEELASRRVVTLPPVEADTPVEVVANILSDAAANNALVVAVSHRPWELDAAMLASFERMCFVHPPDWDARRFRLWESPLGRAVDDAMLDRYVVATEGWCGADLAEAFQLLAEAGAEGERTTGPVTEEWMAEARTWAVRSERELPIDDLVSYLHRVQRW